MLPVRVVVAATARTAAAVLLVASLGAASGGCIDCGAPLSPDSTIGTDSAPAATDSGDAGGGTDATTGGCTCTSMCAVDTTVAAPVAWADVEPIFSNNCSNGACHVDPGGLGSGEVLTATELCNYTVNMVATETAGTSMMNRITPSDPEASYLFHKVRGTHRLPPADGSGCRMPLGYCCLSPQDLGKIREWIIEGAMCM
ncbi:MAG TPA: hypothetical protein VG389_22760 [Myxococcota bacterium]|nr:hypothetical protein [Myxococcota bacterium]